MSEKERRFEHHSHEEHLHGLHGLHEHELDEVSGGAAVPPLAEKRPMCSAMDAKKADKTKTGFSR